MAQLFRRSSSFMHIFSMRRNSMCTDSSTLQSGGRPSRFNRFLKKDEPIKSNTLHLQKTNMQIPKHKGSSIAEVVRGHPLKMPPGHTNPNKPTLRNGSNTNFNLGNVTKKVEEAKNEGIGRFMKNAPVKVNNVLQRNPPLSASTNTPLSVSKSTPLSSKPMNMVLDSVKHESKKSMETLKTTNMKPLKKKPKTQDVKMKSQEVKKKLAPGTLPAKSKNPTQAKNPKQAKSTTQAKSKTEPKNPAQPNSKTPGRPLTPPPQKVKQNSSSNTTMLGLEKMKLAVQRKMASKKNQVLITRRNSLEKTPARFLNSATKRKNNSQLGGENSLTNSLKRLQFTPPTAPITPYTSHKVTRDPYQRGRKDPLLSAKFGQDTSAPTDASSFGFTKRKKKYKKKKVAARLVTLEVVLPTQLTVQDLASRMCTKIINVFRVMRNLGEKKFDAHTMISQELAELIVSEKKMKPILLPPVLIDLEPTVVEDTSDFPTRPPIITIMGHVDHGKTTLLDKLRNSTLAANEHGGITQRMAAFTVTFTADAIEDSCREMTIIDTPGHAAFSAMREHGSEVTDMIVLVVSAEDGVRPQTKEVIKLARKFNVPLLVALTKCDRLSDNEANDRAKIVSYELSALGVMCESVGGEVQMVRVSGKTGQGIIELQQAVALQAEMMDLRADALPAGEAVILDAYIAKGTGVVVDAIATWGTLSLGTYIVTGTQYGKIKSLLTATGEKVKSVASGLPVRIIGLKSLPESGNALLPAKNESHAKEIVSKRADNAAWITARAAPSVTEKGAYYIKPKIRTVSKTQKKYLHKERMRLEKEENTRIMSLKPGEEGYVRNVIPFIFKTDAHGVIAAIDNLVADLPSLEVVAKVVHAGVGPINESDLKLAYATGATIFTFNQTHPVSLDRKANRTYTFYYV